MPFTFTSEISIKASPDRVFAAMTDLEGAKQWMQGLVSLEQITPGEFGVGTQWRETRRMYGKNASEVFEVATFEPPRRLGLRVDGSKGSSKKGEYRFDLEITPTSDGSNLRLAGVIDMPGFFSKVVGRLFVGSFKRAVDKDNRALKEYLEGQPQEA